MKRPLFCAGMALALGEAMYIYTDGGELCVALATLLFGAFYFGKRYHNMECVYGLSVALLLGVLHAFCFVTETEETRETREVLLGGIVEERVKDDTVVLSVRGQEEGGVLSYKDKVLLYDIAPEIFFRMEVGDYIEIKGEYHMFLSPTNPGSFNQKVYYEAKGIKGYLYDVQITDCIPYGTKSWEEDDVLFMSLYYRMKRGLGRFREACKRQLYSMTGSENAGIYAGILLGDKTELSGDIKMLYQRAGIAHLLAISGLHVSMIGGLFYKLLRKLRLGFAKAGILSIGLVILYGWMTGAALATLRAVIMLSIAMFAEILGESYDLLTSMTIALVALVLIRPERIQDGGMQLSFTAIAGVYFGRFIQMRLNKDVRFRSLKKRRKHLYALCNSIIMAAAIQVIMMPVIAMLYYEVPVYGLLLNLIVVPLMSVVVLSGMAGLIIGSFWSLAGSVALQVGGMVLHFYEWLCQMTQRLPFCHLITGHVSIWQLFLYYGSLVGLVWFLRSRRCHKIKTLLLISSLFIFLCGVGEYVLYKYDCYGMFMALDVGQGQGILIRTEQGANYVIDGGSVSQKKLGEYTVVPALKYLHMQHVDAWLISHTDEDHISGLMYILEQEDMAGISIGQIVVSKSYRNAVSEDDALAKLVLLADRQNIPVVGMGYGQSLTDGVTSLTCVHPDESYVRKQEGQPEKNTCSLALSYESPDTRALILGDMDTEAIDYMLEEHASFFQSGNKEKKYDTLVVPHHGSRSSLSTELYEMVDGQVIISCGYENRYGHPHREVTDCLKHYGLKCYRTDENGAVVFRSFRHK